MTISASTPVSRNPALVHTELDGQTMMMSVEVGKYFALNRIGTRIWHLIEHPMTTGDIVAALTREFDVDAERCQAETTAFLQRLLADGLIQVDPA